MTNRIDHHNGNSVRQRGEFVSANLDQPVLNPFIYEVLDQRLCIECLQVFHTRQVLAQDQAFGAGLGKHFWIDCKYL